MPTPDAVADRPPDPDERGTSGALRPQVRPREVFAWAMYDFANSGYTTVVLTAVFNAYFVSVVAQQAPWATFAWTATLGVSYLAVMLLGPIVGAYADATASKKRILLLVTAGCVIATAGLFFARRDALALAVCLVIVSNFCYAIGENISAAFLPELAKPDALGRVSGWGWAWGYVGGLIALALCLAWLATAEARGMTAVEAVPMTNLITAGLYALGASATFLWLRERAVADKRIGGSGPDAPWSHAWTRLAATWRMAARYRDLLAMFLCGALYQAGVATVVALAAIYAQAAMGFQTRDTLLLVLVVNVTACAGALGFGYVQDAIGKKRALAVTLLIWIAMIAFAWFATTRTLFWVAANLAGIAMGSSQSAGRALVAYFSPAERAAEFFGLWGMATRLAAILGPLTYGAVSWVSGGNHRLAMLLTGIFFIAALAALSRVDEARGRQAALAG